MPTTYPGIPVLTNDDGRQIIPVVKPNGGDMIAYLLRWTPQDEAGLDFPDGVWDAYIVTENGPDDLIVNGHTREGASRIVLDHLRASGTLG